MRPEGVNNVLKVTQTLSAQTKTQSFHSWSNTISVSISLLQSGWLLGGPYVILP